MEPEERAKRHFMIFSKIGGGLFSLPDPVPLPTGEDYVSNMKPVLAKRVALFEELRQELTAFNEQELSEHFAADGQQLTDEAKKLTQDYRSDIRGAFDRVKIWYAAPLFRTKALADFKHWGRSEFLSLDEIVWLSVGLEPSPELMAAIAKYDKIGNANKLDAVATYMSRHKEIIRRKFDPPNLRDKPNLTELCSWIREVELEVHPDFLAILDAKFAPASVQPVSEPQDENIDRRAYRTLVTLIAAMAKDGYGWDHTAKRGPIPKQIESVCDQLGVAVSKETILKYMREGAAYFQDDA